MVKWCREERVAHIHAHFATNSATVVMIARIMGGVPYSFTVHGAEELEAARFNAIRQKIDHAAFVVAISAFGRSQLLRHTPFAQWDKIMIVRCGLDEGFSEGDIPPVPDNRRLVCVGRLCEQKGQLLLLDAMRELLDEGLDFELVFAGDGDLRAEIEKRIRRHRLDEHVTITGWISSAEVRRQIIMSRTMILPSFIEGLPVAIMEAMVLRRPVISTYVAGIPELVEPHGTGWLVPPGVVAPLKQAIRDGRSS